MPYTEVIEVAVELDSRLKQAWEAALEGVLIFADERVLYLNPIAAELLGIERERVLGKPMLLALRDHKLDVLCRIGGQTLIETRGKTLWAKAEAGILFLWDKTEEKKRLDALEESSRVLAHEFRTPVTGMVALVEALRTGLSPADSEEVLSLIEQEVQRLKRLVEDLPLNRIPTGNRTFAIAELSGRLEKFLAPALAEKSAWIHWELNHTIKANPDAVYQALLNLLDNAVKYGSGGEIQVVSEARQDGIYLEVRDRGKPIQDFEHLFQAGQRGMHAANVRGTGLGLSLVRRLALGWGGQAYGRTTETGNAFGLTFPNSTEIHKPLAAEQIG